MDIITYGLLNKKIKQKADLNSPHFTGEPTAPTPDYPDNSERLATTEYVNEAVAGAGGGVTYQLSRTGKILRLSGSDSSISEAELPYTCMTTAEWEEQPPTVSEPGALYIWSDYRINDQGENVCGIKIGDGNGAGTPSAAGVMSIQLSKDGVLQAQGQSAVTDATTDIDNMSFTTLVQVKEDNTCSCCSGPTVLSVINTGVPTAYNIANIVVTKIC